jgi:branched-chain amino acid transport system permease protein
VSVERAIAWTLSGFVVGVAGALYGHYFGGTFGPDDFFFNNGFNIVLLSIAMLVVGGMTSVTGAVVGCYFVTVVYEVFRRWEVNGLGSAKPPSGTANLVLALVLLVTLVLRPKGITGGKEIPWPAEWRLPRRPVLRPSALRARFRGTAAANEPTASAETAATE